MSMLSRGKVNNCEDKKNLNCRCIQVVYGYEKQIARDRRLPCFTRETLILKPS
jgi:hypothetical protein